MALDDAYATATARLGWEVTRFELESYLGGSLGDGFRTGWPVSFCLGGAGDASSKVARGGQSSASDGLAGVVGDADRVGPVSVSAVSAPEDADAEATGTDAPRVSSLTQEDSALLPELDSDSPLRRQERGALAVVWDAVLGART
ncbi:hypothetical protein MRX96_018148 [Rhipicephalus microplus]